MTLAEEGAVAVERRDIHHQVQEVVDKHLDRQLVAGQDRQLVAGQDRQLVAGQNMQLVAELHKLEEEAEQDMK